MIEADSRPATALQADPLLARRISELVASVGPAVEAELTAIVAGAVERLEDSGTIPAAEGARLVTAFGLHSPTELALLALPVARSMARPPISGYRVAAVGIETETGDMVLGANLEFPGSELGTTIHAEGFVALRARRRGRTLATLVVREARPCAHCRQTLAESAAADDLVIVDTLGHAVRLDDIYPWPFKPAALGVDGDNAGRVGWPNLVFVPPGPPDAIAAPLLDIGAHAHAPYSGSPSAVVLALRDGRTAGAGCVESVAFNPSISALQAALVELAAARIDPTEIVAGWLGCLEARAVDPEPGFRALLRAVAPAADANVARWRSA